MALPPVAGAVNEIVACPFPGVADTAVGASGTVAGVTEFDGDEDALVPIALVAVTVKVYEVPLVNPVTVMGLTVEVAKAPVFAAAV
jgi:hypothetical protein